MLADAFMPVCVCVSAFCGGWLPQRSVEANRGVGMVTESTLCPLLVGKL